MIAAADQALYRANATAGTESKASGDARNTQRRRERHRCNRRR